LIGAEDGQSLRALDKILNEEVALKLIKPQNGGLNDHSASAEGQTG
jgi:hypothetical protein